MSARRDSRPDDSPSVALRHRIPPDDAGIVALYNLQEADSEPLTIERYRMEHAEQGGDRQCQTWVAGEGKRPVGMTFLKRLNEDAAENDYTGVASAHRGRGIATALKLRAIAWAREHGVRWFYTSSEIGNTRMIGINQRLGYRPGVRRLEVEARRP